MHAMVILGLTFRRGKRIFWVLNDHHINFMGVWGAIPEAVGILKL